jgi:hypothetical protein
MTLNEVQGVVKWLARDEFLKKIIDPGYTNSTESVLSQTGYNCEINLFARLIPSKHNY